MKLMNANGVSGGDSYFPSNVWVSPVFTNGHVYEVNEIRDNYSVKFPKKLSEMRQIWIFYDMRYGLFEIPTPTPIDTRLRENIINDSSTRDRPFLPYPPSTSVSPVGSANYLINPYFYSIQNNDEIEQFPISIVSINYSQLKSIHHFALSNTSIDSFDVYVSGISAVNPPEGYYAYNLQFVAFY